MLGLELSISIENLILFYIRNYEIFIIIFFFDIVYR